MDSEEKPSVQSDPLLNNNINTEIVITRNSATESTLEEGSSTPPNLKRHDFLFKVRSDINTSMLIKQTIYCLLMSLPKPY